MKRTLFVAVGLIAVAAPAQAQLTGIVNYAVPVGGMPSTHLVGEFGRGLNEDSGKQQNAFAGAVGRTGVGGRGSVFAGASFINSDPDSQTSFGLVGAVGVSQPEAPTQISVQAGIGYMSPADGVTLWSIPVGVALQRSMPQASGAAIGYWVMPRVHMSRLAIDGFDSQMETNFGASGGVGYTTASGFGFHVALDWLAADGASPLTGGAGVHYMIP